MDRCVILFLFIILNYSLYLYYCSILYYSIIFSTRALELKKKKERAPPSFCSYRYLVLPVPGTVPGTGTMCHVACGLCLVRSNLLWRFSSFLLAAFVLFFFRVFIIIYFFFFSLFNPTLSKQIIYSMFNKSKKKRKKKVTPFKNPNSSLFQNKTSGHVLV